MNRRVLIVVACIILAFVLLGYFNHKRQFPEKSIFRTREPIKVGLLHSLAGTMAISEKAVLDATLLAIEEINQEGGLLGRKIEPIIADGKSDWSLFAEEAERLIGEEKVSVVFGCWTSASRKTVKPVFEKYKHLLFYPVQYEGLEQSPHIIYTGAAPNQQIIPAVKWSFDNLGKRFFLVGSDYVFPRTANLIMKDLIEALGGEVLGEEYIVLGSDEVEGVIQKIVKSQPDVILNTINGDSNIAFFKKLHDAGITSAKIPVMSFSISENELALMDVEDMAGNYAGWNYFQSINTPVNRAFVERFRERYGADRTTNDPMEAAYFGVYLWSQAVKEAGTDGVAKVGRTIKNQGFDAPEGMVYIDAENNHTWKTVRIGKINENGQFDIVWSSEKPIRPIPYPINRSRLDWERFLDGLYKKWGGEWANPGK